MFDAIEPELSILDDKLNDFVQQLSVETATWGLAIYEAELDTPINNTGKPIEERRSVIIAKMRGQGKFDANMIKKIVSSWTGGSADVLFADSFFEIIFTDILGTPSNMEDVENMIAEIKPAHLGVRYIFKYTVWNDIDNANLTWNEIDALNLTWNQLATYKFN